MSQSPVPHGHRLLVSWDVPLQSSLPVSARINVVFARSLTSELRHWGQWEFVGVSASGARVTMGREEILMDKRRDDGCETACRRPDV